MLCSRGSSLGASAERAVGAHCRWGCVWGLLFWHKGRCWGWRVQGLGSLLPGEGMGCLEALLLGCSGSVCVEGGGSGTVGLGTCVWGMWEGRDALTCVMGEVEL